MNSHRIPSNTHLISSAASLYLPDVPKDLADVSDNVKIVAIVIPDAVAIVIAVVSVIVTVLIVAFVIFRVRYCSLLLTP